MVGPDGMPDDGVRAWSDIMLPYDPECRLSASLSPEDIFSTNVFGREPVCETYRCGSDGVITVELRRPGRKDARCYEIYRD